jgi:polyphosphate kinase
MPRVKDPAVQAARYLNRELSWLRFNERVLAEASDLSKPLLERLKFLAIFESNLDEFYMVRVSGFIEQFEAGVLEETPDGLTPNEQLLSIAESAAPLRQKAADVFANELRPELQRAGVHIRGWEELTDKQQADLQAFFQKEVFPLCTPLLLHPSPSVPFISNRSLNLVVELADEETEIRLARVKVPSGVPRAVRVPGRRFDFILLEEVIAHSLNLLFPGVDVMGAYLFRVLRDADVEIRELEAADLISTIEQSLRLRRFGDPVLLEVQTAMPQHVRKVLLNLLKLDEEDMFAVDGILGMEVFWEIAGIDRPNLRYAPHHPFLAEPLSSGRTLFETISGRDVLTHQPYDSFRSVEEFISAAATDPAVIGIKQTLYRVGKKSPIVESLLDAAEAGKQVACMVELKARFDESNNLVWAKTLEHAGVHVTYGFRELKTHCKLCLVVRRERGGVKQYAHIGTGNYNPETARIYTDLGLFTCDPDITQDISELFNYLTGFSRQTSFRKLLVAPINLREGILERIDREIKAHKAGAKGRIIFKLNSLVDPEVIDALYTASKAGVQVDLIVRGICCLRPGVPGLSEHIHVISIVGRFLEHSRAFYFANGEKADVLIGSADLMRRNLDRRIEVLAPVEQEDLKRAVLKEVLLPCLKDNVRSWQLLPDGTYLKVTPDKKHEAFDVQEHFIANPLSHRLFPSTRKRRTRKTA